LASSCNIEDFSETSAVSSVILSAVGDVLLKSYPALEMRTLNPLRASPMRTLISLRTAELRDSMADLNDSESEYMLTGCDAIYESIVSAECRIKPDASLYAYSIADLTTSKAVKSSAKVI